MKQVFCFTVKQALRSTGIKVTTAIFCLIILLSMPVMRFINEKGAGSGAALEKVLVWDETGLNIGDFSGMKEKAAYKNVTFAVANSEKEVKGQTLLLHLIKSEAGYTIRFTAAANSDLSEMTVMELSDDFMAEFQRLREKSQNLTKEQSKALSTEITTDIVGLNEDGSIPGKEENEVSENQYNLILGVIVLFVMLISFSAEAVSTSVVTEKSNKLVENLMISVKTDHLILGKILGSLAVVAIQVCAMFLCFVISALLCLVFFGSEKGILPEQVSAMLDIAVLPGLTLVNLIVALLIFFFGVIQFSILAGFFGAAISKMEDMGEGMKLYNLILLFSAYICLFVEMGSFIGSVERTELIKRVISFIPLCSPFTVPMNLLTGQTTLVVSLCVMVVQVLCLVLSLKLVTRVYTTMILYKGNVLKFSQIMRLIGGKEVAQ